MTIEQNKAIVTRFNKEVIEEKNETIFPGLFAPDFINRTARPGMPPGPEGMLLFLQTVLWKALGDIEVEIHDQVAEGDKVTTRKTIHGTHISDFFGQPASGKRLHIHLIDIVRLHNGKYAEHWGVFDTNNVIMQMTS